MPLFTAEKEQVIKIAIDKLVPNEHQPRYIFEDDKIKELAESILLHGVIQPIIVRKKGEIYEIVAGERRYRASKMAGIKEIPAIVKNYDDFQKAEVAIIENIQREDLTPIEEAQAFERLISLYNYTQNDLAKKVGKSQSTVANKLRLLNLADDVKDALRNRAITERHARALLRFETETAQVNMLKKITEENLNVKQTEEEIENHLNPKDSKPRKQIGYTKDIRIALNTIRQAIKMIEKVGISPDVKEKDGEEFFEISIKIKK